MFSIDLRRREPIYEQLVNNIIMLITNGALMPDEQLPSVRNLARDLGINPNTVQKAYQELESRGLVYHAAGRGSFISPGDDLTRAVLDEHIASVEQEMLSAKKAGVAKGQMIELVEKIYREVGEK